MLYWIVSNFFKFISFFYFPLTIYGKENLPVSGPFILASNHASNIDPPTLSTITRRRLSFFAKDSLFKNKISSFLMKRLKSFPVRRGKPDIRALREAIKRLKAGSPLVVFPQGTRREATDYSAHPGIGFLVVKSGVPVIPVHIGGSEYVLPPGAKWLQRHPVVIKIGPPIQFSQTDSYPQITHQVMEKIKELAVS